METSTPSQTDILTISKEEKSAEFTKLQITSNYKISITTNTNNTSLTIPQNLHNQWFMLSLTSITISNCTSTTITIHSSPSSSSTLTYNSFIININQISISLSSINHQINSFKLYDYYNPSLKTSPNSTSLNNIQINNYQNSGITYISKDPNLLVFKNTMISQNSNFIDYDNNSSRRQVSTSA